MQFLQTVFGTSASSTRSNKEPLATFVVDELVEYLSTNGSWIRAKVLKVNGDGTYALDCKPGSSVTVEKIRKLPATKGGSGAFNVGEMVEYYSDSKKDWIPAKVVKANASGSYDLDCKPNVPASKIRQGVGHGSTSFVPPPRGASIDGKASSNAFRAPLQLLKPGRGGMEVNSDAAKALQSFGSRRIAVVSVCGPSRTGKTFIANLLTERLQKGLPQFPMDEKSRTEGLWVLGVLDETDSRSPLLAYFDYESFGEGKLEDQQKIVLCTILSSVLVINTTGELTDDVFGKLGAFQNLPGLIDERGNVASKPFVHWVLHDLAKDLGAASSDKYLEQALQSRQGKKINDLLKALMMPNPTCTALKQPVKDSSQFPTLSSLPYAKLSPDYRKGVETMKDQVIKFAQKKPKNIGGRDLDCSSFMTFTTKLVTSLNAGRGQINVKEIWEQCHHEALDSLKSDVKGQVTQPAKDLQEGSGGKRQGVAMTFTCGNISYKKLHDDPIHLGSFHNSVKDAIKTGVGGGIDHSHIKLELSEGSVVVKASVVHPAPKSYGLKPEISSPSDLHSKLSAVSGSLARDVASRLTSLPGFAAAVTNGGDLDIRLTAAPTLQDVPALPMNDDSLEAYFKEHRDEALAKWEKESMGDEGKKRENWKQIVKSLDAEEHKVREKNVTLARDELKKILRPWNKFVKSESKDWNIGDRIISELCNEMGRFPRNALVYKEGGRPAGIPLVLRDAIRTCEQVAEAQRTKEFADKVHGQLEQFRLLAEKSSQGSLKAQEELKGKVVELDEVFNKMQLIQTERDDMKEQLAKTLTELAEERSNYDRLKDEVRSTSDRDEALKRDHEETRELLRRYESEFAELQGSAGNALTYQKGLEIQVEESRLLHMALEKEKEAISRELEELISESRSHKRRADEMRIASDDFQEKYEEEQRRNQLLSEQSRQREDEAREADARYARRREDDARLARQIEERIGEKREYRGGGRGDPDDRMRELEWELSETKERLRLVSVDAGRDGRGDIFMHELADTREKLKTALADLNSQVESHKSLLEQTKNDRQKFEEERLAYQKKIEAESQASDQAKHYHSQFLETEKNRLQKDAESLRIENNELHSKYTSLESDAKVKTNRLQELELKEQQAQDDAAALATQLEDARCEIQRLHGLQGGQEDRLREERRRADEKRDEHYRAQEELRRAREDDKKRLLERERDAAKNSGEAEVYKEERDRLKEDRNKLQEELIEAKRTTAAAEAAKSRIERLEKEVEALENDKKKSAEEIQTLKANARKAAQTGAGSSSSGSMCRCFGKRSI